jgi:hypothetical protein
LSSSPILLLLLLLLLSSTTTIAVVQLFSPILLLLLLLFSSTTTSPTSPTPLLSSPVLYSYFSYSSPLLSSSTITVVLNINLGEEMSLGLPSSDIPSFWNYAYNLGFTPTLGMTEHPYPSIVSNMF